MSDSVLLTDDHPVDPDDELLVAYLDGELDDAERGKVEKRLLNENEFRLRLQKLQSGWDWLDDLPEESASEILVASTIELIATDVEPVREQRESWVVRHRAGLVIFGASLLAVLLGGLSVAMYRRVQLNNELSELAIVEHLPAYRLPNPDFDTMRELAGDPRWQKMLYALENVGDQSFSPGIELVSDGNPPNLERLQTLPDEKRASLDAKWTRYRNFNDSERRQIRRTAELVSAEPDRDDLLRTMDAYATWYETLRDDLKDRIRSSDEETRRQATSEAIDESIQRLYWRSGKLISDETSDRLYLGLQAIWYQRLNELPTLRDALDKFREEARKRSGGISSKYEGMMELFILTRLVNSESQTSRPRGGGGRKSGPPGRREPMRGGVPPFFPRYQEITDQELQDLWVILDDQAQVDMEMLIDLQPEIDEQIVYNATLKIWCEEAIGRQMRIRMGSDKPLAELYQATEDREALDLQSPREFERRLREPAFPDFNRWQRHRQ